MGAGRPRWRLASSGGRVFAYPAAAHINEISNLLPKTLPNGFLAVGKTQDIPAKSLVRTAGLEPAQGFPQGILSLFAPKRIAGDIP